MSTFLHKPNVRRAIAISVLAAATIAPIAMAATARASSTPPIDAPADPPVADGLVKDAACKALAKLYANGNDRAFTLGQRLGCSFAT